jgi:hypothetical protein
MELMSGGMPEVYVATPLLKEDEEHVFIALWGDKRGGLTVPCAISNMAERGEAIDDESMFNILESLAKKGLLLELNSSGVLMYDRSGFGGRVARRIHAGVCFLPNERQYAAHIVKCRRCTQPRAPTPPLVSVSATSAQANVI